MVWVRVENSRMQAQILSPTRHDAVAALLAELAYAMRLPQVPPHRVLAEEVRQVRREAERAL